MSNPFEQEDGRYRVLRNQVGQHSLWPVFLQVPDGWTVVHEEDSRAACLEYVERNWTDLKPLAVAGE
ncbi:MbtH family protein [Catenulispora pinisilvae]|uniref:MbtH family protein n=1 Tax=Catenulispora pinisilvae TaxID=2705253 RepID=UPI00189127AA|nr:MbtH family protein [Catenulispora pinisilvae]